MAMTSSDDVIAFLELNSKPGDKITMTVIGGNGSKQDLSVTLGARPTVGR